MTTFEKATLAAIKAFMDHYDMLSTINSDLDSPIEPGEEGPFAESARSSNGIPICERHGKAMLKSKFGSGYYCGSETSPGTGRQSKNGKWYCDQKRQ